MLVDTDVLIDYLRGLPQAVQFIEKHHAVVHVSSVSVAELYQGVRDGREMELLSSTINALSVLPLAGEIARKAGIYRRDHRDRLGSGLADCMIAATASHHGLRLVTLNQRHFAMLEDVIVPYRK